jgi:hypothetical protein
MIQCHRAKKRRELLKVILDFNFNRKKEEGERKEFRQEFVGEAADYGSAKGMYTLQITERNQSMQKPIRL